MEIEESQFYVCNDGRRRFFNRITCEICNNEFLSKTKRGRFCSLECKQKYLNVGSFIAQCAYCGSDVKKPNSKKKSSKSGFLFCNKKCYGLALRLGSGITEIYPPHYGTGDPKEREFSKNREEYLKGDNIPNNCEICGHKNRLVVDHDHLTGNIRGILCMKCNFGIGYFQDNTELMFNAINYLNKL